MKKFLIRLFNLQPQECPSCQVYRKWIDQIVATSDSNVSILTAEINELRSKLDSAYHQFKADQSAERTERQELEDTILKWARLRHNPDVPQKVPYQMAAPNLQPGQPWNKVRAQLEAEARKKADIFRKRESDEIRAGRLAPNENIRDTQEVPIKGGGNAQ